MAADAPAVLVAAAGEVLVAGHQVVEVLHLEGDMVELDHARAHREEGVMVDVLGAAIAAHERGEHLLSIAEIDLVRVHEAEVRVVEGLGRAEVVDQQDEVAEALDVRRAALDAWGAPRRRRSLPTLTARGGGGASGGTAAMPCTTSTAMPLGSVSRTRWPPPGSSMCSTALAPSARAMASRSAALRRLQADTDEAGIAELGDVQMVLRIGAAHVERRRRARGAHHAEVGEEGLRAVEVGRAKADVRQVGDFDHLGSSRVGRSEGTSHGGTEPRRARSSNDRRRRPLRFSVPPCEIVFFLHRVSRSV